MGPYLACLDMKMVTGFLLEESQLWSKSCEVKMLWIIGILQIYHGSARTLFIKATRSARHLSYTKHTENICMFNLTTTLSSSSLHSPCKSWINLPTWSLSPTVHLMFLFKLHIHPQNSHSVEEWWHDFQDLKRRQKPTHRLGFPRIESRRKVDDSKRTDGKKREPRTTLKRLDEKYHLRFFLVDKLLWVAL